MSDHLPLIAEFELPPLALPEPLAGAAQLASQMASKVQVITAMATPAGMLKAV